MELTTIFRAFEQFAAPAAVTALWQGLMLVLGLAVCLRLASRIPAADRFHAWAAGFVVLAALPFLPLIHFGGSLAGVSREGIAAAGAPAHAWLSVNPVWALGIAGLWIAASFWRVGDLMVHALRVRRVWKRATPIEMSGAPAPVCSTQDLDRPSVIGFLRPRILVPAWLLAKLTQAELEQVILHEAEHLRRRDDWTNLLQKLALVVFPLNPGLAWMERQLCHEREMACDDAVVRATGKPRAYAACLASLAERGLQHRREALQEVLTLGAWRKRPELVGRVHRLLKAAPGLNPTTARTVLALVACGLMFGSVEFARAPQLVAFVAPVIAQSATPDLVNRDARPMAGYRAVNAMAMVPSRAELTGFKRVAGTGKNQPQVLPLSAHAVQGHRQDDKHVSQERMPEARMIDTAKNQTPPAPQQWIVLTTYEQVVTMPQSARRNQGTVADYDANATAEEAPASGSVVQQWTITRLIVRVDPAQGAARNEAGSAKMSQPAQPAMQPATVQQLLQMAPAPLQAGWLVFQL